MTNERDLAAVVAHGLLTSAAVLSGSAFALREFGPRLTAEERAAVVIAVQTHAALLDAGVKLILAHCSDAFGDAATAIALIASTVAEVTSPDLPDVLDGLTDHITVVSAGLGNLVRGLPEEVVELLDSLRR